jgi:hypothetical protein
VRGGVQKGAEARGQATWAVSTANAWMWVSGGCGEDRTDTAGPPTFNILILNCSLMFSRELLWTLSSISIR